MQAKQDLVAEMRQALSPSTFYPKGGKRKLGTIKEEDGKDSAKQKETKSKIDQVVTDAKYSLSTWVKNTNSFRNLLNTSKGRDKCA